MQRIVLSILLALSLAATAAAADQYRLDNGMEVVLEENHASPMIAAMVFVKAGAKYEQPQNNGVTHFLEHLLFNGTADRSQEQLEPVIDLFGGYINAFTRKEMTGYLVLMPREYIDTGLAIVADMLTNSIIPDAKVEKERGIVTEEIRRNTDNPDYLLESAFAAYNYRGTPYARPVLGFENTIATIPRQDILDYYRTYYVPNNMVALVMGDFDTPRMQEKIERYFGAAPAGRLPDFPPLGYTPPSGQDLESRFINLPQPRLVAVFAAPHFEDIDYPAVELWVDYLNATGQSPFLARVKDGPDAVATRASVGLSTYEEFSELEVDLTLKPEVAAAEAMAAVLEGLNASARKLPTTDEMQAMITSEKADEYGLKERLHYYGIMRGPLFVVAGYDFVAERVNKLAAVTARDLKQATSPYAGKPSYRAMYAAAPPLDTTTAERTADRFAYKVLPNGLTAIVKSNPDSKVFGAALILKNRSASEPEGKAGIVDFCQRLLTRGAGDLDAGGVSQKLAELGASITVTDNPYIPYDDFYTSPQYSFIKFDALDEYAPEALELLYTLVAYPTFDSAATEQVRGEMMAALGMSSQSTSTQARDLFADRLFASGPLSHPEMGSPRTIGGITDADLREFWKNYASPGNIVLAIATGTEPEAAMGWIESSFGDIPTGAAPTLASQPPLLKPEGVVRAHLPMEKKQVVIDLGGPTCGPRDADAPAVQVMVSILSERLKNNLREKQGLAYSVGAGVGFTPTAGWYSCRMGTGVDNYDVALKGILGEIEGLREGQVAPEELLRAQNGIWGQMLTRRLARNNQCYYLALNEFMGLGYRHDAAFVETLRSVTADEVRRVARKYLSTKDYILATVGDTGAGE